MNRIKPFSLKEDQEWENCIRAFSSYDIYYLPSYSKAFHLHGDGEPMLIYFEYRGTKAATVIMKRDIANDPFFSGKIPEETFFDLSTPYGYGGFIFEGPVDTPFLEELKKQYATFCQSNGIVSEFVRFHPLLQNQGFWGNIFHVADAGKTISMELSSPQTIWANLSSKNRNMIRKAKKSGIQVYWGRSKPFFSEFKAVYDITMTRDNAKEYYFFDGRFYESILNDLKYNALVFYAVYEGTIIASSILLFCNKTMHYHLSGSLPEFRHLAPSNLLLYEAACWGCESGLSLFHLGGGVGSAEDSLFKFKRSFNRHSENTFCVGKYIFDEEKYMMLVKLRNPGTGVDKSVLQDFEGFFPRYRK